MSSETEKIGRLAQSIFGEDPRKIIHMPYGHGSVTYDIELKDRNIILRTNKNPDIFQKTADNIKLLGELGLPVPTVLKVDTDTSLNGFAYMALLRIPGQDLGYELSNMSLVQKDKLAEQLVSFQRKVMTLSPGRGYGYAPLNALGEYDTWPAMLQAQLENKQLTANSYEAELLESIKSYLKLADGDLLTIPPTCFLDDLTTKNVIMLNGELQGLIDFDVVCYGDPLWWLSLVAITIVADLGKVDLSYFDMLCEHYDVSDKERSRLALYQMMHGLDFVVRLSDHPAEWQKRIRSHIDEQRAVLKIS